MKSNKKVSTFYLLPSTFSQRGFTLIEIVIYIALLSIVTSFVMVVFYQMIDSEDQHRNRVEVDSEANFMMQKILWALTGATAINEPTAGATSSVLSVDKVNFGQNPIVFDVGSRNLRISKGGSAAELLGNRRVFVDTLLFEHVPQVQNAPEAVKITLTVVSSDITRPAASTTIENTIYLRQ